MPRRPPQPVRKSRIQRCGDLLFLRRDIPIQKESIRTRKSLNRSLPHNRFPNSLSARLSHRSSNLRYTKNPRMRPLNVSTPFMNQRNGSAPQTRIFPMRPDLIIASLISAATVFSNAEIACVLPCNLIYQTGRGISQRCLHLSIPAPNALADPTFFHATISMPSPPRSLRFNWTHQYVSHNPRSQCERTSTVPRNHGCIRIGICAFRPDLTSKCGHGRTAA